MSICRSNCNRKSATYAMGIVPSAWIGICMFICLYTHAYINIYVYIYICIYIYIHTHTFA